MKLIQKLIHEITDELQKDHNKQKLENHLLDPCMNFVIQKIQPYVIATTILILILVISISFIIYLLLSK